MNNLQLQIRNIDMMYEQTELISSRPVLYAGNLTAFCTKAKTGQSQIQDSNPVTAVYLFRGLSVQVRGGENRTS